MDNLEQARLAAAQVPQDHVFLHETDIDMCVEGWDRLGAGARAAFLEETFPQGTIWVYGGGGIGEDVLTREGRVVPVRFVVSRDKDEVAIRFRDLLRSKDPSLAQAAAWPESLVGVHLLCWAKALLPGKPAEIERLLEDIPGLRKAAEAEYKDLTGGELGRGGLGNLAGAVACSIERFTKEQRV